jgi:hypothetical protein
MGSTAAVFLLCAVTTAAQDSSVPLIDRTRGAERVVVGRVSRVDAVWRTNEHGDRLIVSIARVAIDETLKGSGQTNLDVEVEGGTIGAVTLHVSDVDPVAAGDRAVFYLKRNSRAAYVPHLRGHGILQLDRSDRVRGSNLRLADVRRAAAEAR